MLFRSTRRGKHAHELEDFDLTEGLDRSGGASWTVGAVHEETISKETAVTYAQRVSMIAVLFVKKSGLLLEFTPRFKRLVPNGTSILNRALPVPTKS